ncbi:MAG: hypothetical protein ACQXXL_00685 [Candidatus Methanosuratincola sp.]|nr:hypothetical protein [Candidatus Methanosuratincola sp.]
MRIGGRSALSVLAIVGASAILLWLSIPPLLSATVRPVYEIVSVGAEEVECRYEQAPEGIFFERALNFAALKVNVSGIRSSIGPVTTLIVKLPDNSTHFLRSYVYPSDAPPRVASTRFVDAVYEAYSAAHWLELQQAAYGEGYELSLDASDFIEAYNLMLRTTGKDCLPSDASVVGIVPISDRYLLYTEPSKIMAVGFDWWGSGCVTLSIVRCLVDGIAMPVSGTTVDLTGLGGEHRVELTLEAEMPLIFWWKPVFTSSSIQDLGQS